MKKTDPLVRLTRGVARALGDGPSLERRARQRASVIHLGQDDLEHSTRYRRHWLALPVAAAALILLFWVGQPDGELLVVSVGGQPIETGQRLSADERSLTLEFSDDSQVRLNRGTTVQLTESDHESLKLRLDHGRMDLDVTPSGHVAWVITAGPYSVEVTGTQFSVDWEPEESSLAVQVRQGTVYVRGASLGVDGVRLAAGQNLKFNKLSGPMARTSGGQQVDSSDCRGNNCLIRNRREQSSSTENDKNFSECQNERCNSQAQSKWRDLAARGEHEAALVAVGRKGIKTLVARSSSKELAELAHSARMAGATGTAREALQALRKRFPSHPLGRQATFLLGRVALDIGEDRKASEWFEKYLREQPSGELSEEARSRLMRVWHRRGDHPRAQELATEYLQHHPAGRSSGFAQRILSNG